MIPKRTRETRLFDVIDIAVVTFYCGVIAIVLLPVLALCGLVLAACWAEDMIERGKKWLSRG